MVCLRLVVYRLNVKRSQMTINKTNKHHQSTSQNRVDTVTQSQVIGVIAPGSCPWISTTPSPPFQTLSNLSYFILFSLKISLSIIIYPFSPMLCSRSNPDSISFHQITPFLQFTISKSFKFLFTTFPISQSLHFTASHPIRCRLSFHR